MDEVLRRLTEIFPFSSGVCTDSRKVQAGNMFFALRGDNFDGNNFARQALSDGAICAVVERESVFGKRVLEVLADSSYGNEADRERLKKYILTDSPLVTLQALARWHRLQFDIPVLALTGTNGKTTTKELVSAVLSRKFRVSATVGNLNNNIGVPLTLFGISSSTEIAVVEMGASHPGDIKELVDIALPTYGLITNVGKAHLLGFGSFDGVCKTKGEMYDYLLSTDNAAFYNVDNSYLCEMVSSRPQLKKIPYGLKYSGSEVLPVTLEEPYLRLLVRSVIVSTHLVGSYNADNVMTALAVGEYFGVPFEDACAAISEYVPTNNRSELRRTSSNTLVIDAYNANPSSMKVSLENFEATEYPNKMLILGDMRELGADSNREHHDIFDIVMKMSVSKVLFVGSEFMELKSVYQTSASQPETLFFLNVEMLKEYLDKEPVKGHTILIKGSNGIRLQSILEKL